jgi:hypothetical protein
MDPLSITASGITIAGLGTGVVKGFKQCRRIHNAPVEVQALIDELANVQVVVRQAEDVAVERLTRLSSPDRTTTSLLKFVEAAKKTILEIENKVYRKLIKDEDTAEKIKLAKLAWLRERSRIVSLRKGLHEHRMNLLVAIGSATL